MKHTIALFIGFSFLFFTYNNLTDDMNKDMLNKKLELISKGEYKCCLETPCTYCLVKHEDSCDCLDDLMVGVHPCGECIGEILEGHGNPLLSEYFATAIAEKVGEQHIDTLKQIIYEKYDMPIENQL